MDELVPICLGMAMGVLLWRGRWSGVVGAAALVLIGLTATVLSGEYLTSWSYLVPDVGEAALGLLAGFLIARRYWPKPVPPQTPAGVNRIPINRR